MVFNKYNKNEIMVKLETLIAEVVQKFMEDRSNGVDTDLNSVIKEIALRENLNPEEIKRVAEESNIQIYEGLFKDVGNRDIYFKLADAKQVISELETEFEPQAEIPETPMDQSPEEGVVPQTEETIPSDAQLDTKQSPLYRPSQQEQQNVPAEVEQQPGAGISQEKQAPLVGQQLEQLQETKKQTGVLRAQEPKGYPGAGKMPSQQQPDYFGDQKSPENAGNNSGQMDTILNRPTDSGPINSQQLMNKSPEQLEQAPIEDTEIAQNMNAPDSMRPGKYFDQVIKTASEVNPMSNITIGGIPIFDSFGEKGFMKEASFDYDPIMEAKNLHVMNEELSRYKDAERKLDVLSFKLDKKASELKEGLIKEAEQLYLKEGVLFDAQKYIIRSVIDDSSVVKEADDVLDTLIEKYNDPYYTPSGLQVDRIKPSELEKNYPVELIDSNHKIIHYVEQYGKTKSERDRANDSQMIVSRMIRKLESNPPETMNQTVTSRPKGV